MALPTVLAAAYLLVALLSALNSKGRTTLPPGPLFHVPIIGDGLCLNGGGNACAFFFNRFKRYGSVFRTKLLGARIWVVTDMDALRGVLRDDGATPDVPFPSFKTLMDCDSFIGVEGIHRPWRKVFSSALGPSQLADMVPHITAVAQSHLRGWEAAGKIPTYSASRLVALDLAVDVIADVKLGPGADRAAFKADVLTFLDGLYGLPLNLPGSTLARALAARERCIRALAPGLADVHGRFDAQWRAAGTSPQAYATAVLTKAATELGVTDDAAAAAASLAAGGGWSASRPRDLFAVTASLLGGRAGVQRGEVRDTALSVLHMLVASGDTTCFGLFNTWAVLAKSPRVQQRIWEEQQRVVSALGEGLSPAALAAMPYLDAAIREAMRLLPASSGGVRKLTRELGVAGYTIPAGEYVWYHAGLLHCLDPVLWDGRTEGEVPRHMDWRGGFEEAYRPERWLSPGDGGSEDLPRPRYAFAFGAGAHMCIGQNLVYLELKVLLALTLRRYRLRLETPDMLERSEQLFPLFVPAKGTDTMLLEPR
ncbi:hypothetical protein HYH03_016792 [Edaphochlamys debaryana]|uniref:Cytochrome P450 n=1 Tax=Edaphochlamys debaryana TaxID=47281 RepID=A0A836BPI4_9CHLO|nr:hypothetical protein HYH03_016792 [Edaphochlamys debaryana]|eukprot:KAG2484376.1 hypothetical protein HYH03_016792 [Edaphochlamys debaryana]